MDVTSILSDLNDNQRDAVSHPGGNALVLAGAGSGKTRVLVHRIAWIIQTMGVSPYSILAVTFTNKAAGEMRGRIESLLGIPADGMWVGTFHGLAHRFLRAHYEEANLPKTFQILDSDDQLRLIKRAIKDLELDESKWPARQAQWFINSKKDEGLRSNHLDARGDPTEKVMIRIYQAYEQNCENAGLVDFAELLLRAHELWLKRPDVLEHYRKRFRYILVDEFQDTNKIQYAWIRMLAGPQTHVFIVGDDDQSIYGWRGARIENIHQFQRDFPSAQLIRLEQNYRSTATILKAANQLISHNTERLGKNLWTAGEEGEPIRLYAAFNEQDEARFVVDVIKQWVDQGNERKDCAILYRSNAQSRVLEEALLMVGMPYRVYGGMRFFERQEIRDALAYLRLANNHNDDAAFERIISVPPRGIGERTVQVIRDLARQNNMPMWKASAQVLVENLLPARASNAVKGFITLISELATGMNDLTLAEKIELALETSELVEHYKKEKGERGRTRIENLRELVTAAAEYEAEELDDEQEDALSTFLSYTALESGEGQAGPGDDYVQLMTLHSAKGLEFPLVFLVGLEEGLFPHELSSDDPNRLEEERRLCYVGMTRARQQLYLSYAEHRRMYGRESYALPSRFINEMPHDLIQEIRPRASVSLPMTSRFHESKQETPEGFHVGQRVMHAKFGPGVLLNYEGSGAHARVQVNFENAGTKWLVLAYANLQPA